MSSRIIYRKSRDDWHAADVFWGTQAAAVRKIVRERCDWIGLCLSYLSIVSASLSLMYKWQNELVYTLSIHLSITLTSIQRGPKPRHVQRG